MRNAVRQFAFVAAAGIGILAFGPSASAAPGDSPEAVAEQVRHLREKAETLRAQGRLDDAAALEKAAVELEAKSKDRAAADRARVELKTRIAALREKAARAKEAGRLDEAEACWKEAEELGRKFEGGGHGEKKHAVDHERMAGELREKAQALRAQGDVAGAERLEEKAARVDKSMAMRKEAAELERRAKEAKEAGRPDEAEKLFAESRKVSASADEAIGARRDKGRHDAEAGRKKVQDLRAEAAKLREAGRTEEAARCEEKADAVERWLAGEKPAGAKSADEKAAPEKFAGGKPVGDLSSREAEVRKLESEVEEMRRRVAELEAELERLRQAAK